MSQDLQDFRATRTSQTHNPKVNNFVKITAQELEIDTLSTNNLNVTNNATIGNELSAQRLNGNEIKANPNGGFINITDSMIIDAPYDLLVNTVRSQPLGFAVKYEDDILFQLNKTIVDASANEGDIITHNASGRQTKVNIGTANQVLTVNAGGTQPEWQTLPPSSSALTTNGDILTHNGVTDTRLPLAGANAIMVVNSSGNGVQWASSISPVTVTANLCSFTSIRSNPLFGTISIDDNMSLGTQQLFCRNMNGNGGLPTQFNDGIELPPGELLKDNNATTGSMLYFDSSKESNNLSIGTAGQVLTVNPGATAPEWTTLPPASTALTTKGDILSHNGATDVRIPVGTDGDIVYADSTQASGIKWAPQHAAGQIYFAGNGTATTISNTTSFFEVSIASTLSHNLPAGNWDQPANGRLRNISGTPNMYRVTGVISWEANTNNQQTEVAVLLNGVEVVPSAIKRKIANANDVGSSNVEAFVVLNGTTDYVSLGLKNTTSTANLTMVNQQILVVR